MMKSHILNTAEKVQGSGVTPQTMLDNTIFYMYLAIGTVIFLMVALVVYLIVSQRKGRRERLRETDELTGSRTENLADLVGQTFSDVRDDMIITDGGKRFIAVIRCQGFDLYKAGRDVQLRTKVNYTGFMRELPSQITYRMYGEDVSMDATQEMYRAAYDRIESEAFNLAEDYKQYKENYLQLRTREDGDARETVAQMEAELAAMQERILSYDRRLAHMADQMRYMERISGASGRQRLVQTYVIDWSNDELLGDDMDDRQLRMMATRELEKKCRNMISLLLDAGVKAYRLNNAELCDMIRLHWKPVTGNMLRYADIGAKTTFGDYITTARGYDAMDREYEEDIVDEIAANGGNWYV